MALNHQFADPPNGPIFIIYRILPLHPRNELCLNLNYKMMGVLVDMQVAAYELQLTVTKLVLIVHVHDDTPASRPSNHAMTMQE